MGDSASGQRSMQGSICNLQWPRPSTVTQ